MNTKVREMDYEEISRLYPIIGKLDGWFFRSKETSPYSYTVEGTDRWGRKVSRMGNDPARLLDQCIEDAKNIKKQLKTEPSA